MSRGFMQLVAAVVGVALMMSVNAYSAEIAKQAIRTKIAGIDVILYPTQVKDVVSIAGTLPAGDAAGGDGIALAALTAAMLDKGTLTQDKFAISHALDGAGARLRFRAEPESLDVRGRSLNGDLPMVLKVLADELRNPAFSAEEFAKAKIQVGGTLDRQAESTEFKADETFSQAAFPAGHPNHPASTADWKASIDEASITDVKEFHRKFYGPSHFVLVLVGDIDVAKVRAEIKRDFAGWTGGSALSAPAMAVSAPVDKVVPMPGKTSVTVLIGQTTGLRYADPEALPLRVGVSVLGSGFTGRLMSTVRDKEGLTYHIGAAIENDTFSDGDWSIGASFAPSLLDQGVASTLRELRRWYQGGITAQELEAFKGDMIGSFQVSLADTGGMAEALLRTVQRGLPLSWMDDYPKQIQAVTLEQVNGAIKRYVDLDKLVIVKAGSVTPAATN